VLQVGDLLLFVNSIKGSLCCDIGGFVAVTPLQAQPNETPPDSDVDMEFLEDAAEMDEGDDEDSEESTRSTSTVMCYVCGRG